jgi:exopolyphosphatase / guanosine-5'-triphosphate,3'-diphosphate pyrophosphatase
MMSHTNRKLAAIDIGTNSFHLIIVDVKNDNSIEIIDRDREVVRLGERNGDFSRKIKQDKIEQAIVTLKRFRAKADLFDASIWAVATSAVRESSNQKDFIEKVYTETGIKVEVIDGDEEARLVYLGASGACNIKNKKALVVDIGGGSTEFFVGKKNETLYSASVMVGAVRLSYRFFPGYELTQSRINKCDAWIEKEISRHITEIGNTGFDLCIGTSGTIMSAGLMICAMKGEYIEPDKARENLEFSREEFEKIKTEILSMKTFSERKKIPGMDKKRADIIPAGIIILSKIFELLQIDKITVSKYSLREGIIFDTLQKR